MKVLVTGSASGLAQALLPRLLADPQIDLVLGVDRHQCRFEHEQFVQVLLDLHTPLLGRVVQGMDAVIHLCAAGYAEPDPGERDSALAGMLRDTQNLCALAASAGVRRIVHLSSALVYDPRTDGRGGIQESHARRAPENCVVIQALQALEDWLDDFEPQHPGMRVVRLRPHWVIGPKTASLLKRFLKGRYYPRLEAPQPLLQCVHEDDVAEALRLSLADPVSGAMNLACADAVPLDRLVRLAHWIALPMPANLVARRLERAEAGCFEALRQPLVLDSSRARTQLGWHPRHDSVQAVLKHR